MKIRNLQAKGKAETRARAVGVLVQGPGMAREYLGWVWDSFSPIHSHFFSFPAEFSYW